MTLTPEQFDKLALKEDLKDFYTKKEMDVKFEAVMDVLDHVVHKLDNIQNEFVSNQAAHDRMQATTENQEIRIEKLELKTAS
ncbi:MAG: hypothetical protein WCK11_04690 [Candidatus Falkowbacteria bacterium]